MTNAESIVEGGRDVIRYLCRHHNVITFDNIMFYLHPLWKEAWFLNLNPKLSGDWHVYHILYFISGLGRVLILLEECVFPFFAA